jgi:hypothetical protein
VSENTNNTIRACKCTVICSDWQLRFKCRVIEWFVIGSMSDPQLFAWLHEAHEHAMCSLAGVRFMQLPSGGTAVALESMVLEECNPDKLECILCLLGRQYWPHTAKRDVHSMHELPHMKVNLLHCGHGQHRGLRNFLLKTSHVQLEYSLVLLKCRVRRTYSRCHLEHEHNLNLMMQSFPEFESRELS